MTRPDPLPGLHARQSGNAARGDTPPAASRRASHEALPRPSWLARENLAAGLCLLLLTALAWSLTLDHGSGHGTHVRDAAATPAPMTVQVLELAAFLSGWVVMMIAMMLPAALPLVLLYRAIVSRRDPRRRTLSGMSALLVGYVAVWTAAGLPVHAWNVLARSGAPALAVLPGMLLIAGGVYQFTAFKRECHARCSSPVSFITRHWSLGTRGAVRLGTLHGLDCLGCCAGLMLALVALGMMNLTWMLAAAVIIFVEKTLPGGHRVARPLGLALVLGGSWQLASALL